MFDTLLVTDRDLTRRGTVDEGLRRIGDRFAQDVADADDRRYDVPTCPDVLRPEIVGGPR